MECIHRGADAGADVQRLAVGSVERQQISTRHVTYIHIIFALLAVPVDADRFMTEHARAKDRNDAGLAVGILSRTVYVAIAQRCESKPAFSGKIPQVVFACHLADAVR
jgi:hypothetical protein